MLSHEEFIQHVKDLKALRVQKKKYEEIVKDTNKEIAAIVRELIDYMEATGHETVRLANIGQCILEHSKKYSVDDKEVFIKWMEEKGDLDLVKALHGPSISGYYKEKVENGETLPEGVKTFIKTNIVLRS